MKKHGEANKIIIFATKYNRLNHGIIFRGPHTGDKKKRKN